MGKPASQQADLYPTTHPHIHIYPTVYSLVCGDRVLGTATMDLRALIGYNQRSIKLNHPMYVVI